MLWGLLRKVVNFEQTDFLWLLRFFLWLLRFLDNGCGLSSGLALGWVITGL